MNTLPIVTESLLPINMDEVLSFNPKNVINGDFAIVFDNFLRDELTFKLIKSIQQYYPTTKLYIAEQGVYDKAKDMLYNKLIKAGHEIVYVGFDAGLSVCRNKLMKAVKEPFVFLCDSDNLFTNNTKIEPLVKILKENNEIGFLGILEFFGNKINHYENWLDIKDKVVRYTKVKESEMTGEFFYCDATMNCGLGRKELFNIDIWDNRMKLAEHIDAFLTIKYRTNWKVACSNIVTISNQCYTFDSPIYKAYRGRNKIFWKLYKDKWQVNNIDGWQIEDNVIETKGYSFPEEIKIVEKPVVKVMQRNNVKTIEIEPSNKKAQIIKALVGTGTKWWLLRDSCLSAMNKGILNDKDTIYLGVRNMDDKRKLNDLLIKYNVSFEIDIEPDRQTKMYNVYGFNINVPVPTVNYLSNLYGKDWEKK